MHVGAIARSAERSPVPRRSGKRRFVTFLALALAALALPRGAGAVEPLYAAVHHPISSSSLDAQRRFDEGLTLLYAFSRLASRRAFQHAAAADPSSAIAYWGIAMSYGGN